MKRKYSKVKFISDNEIRRNREVNGLNRELRHSGESRRYEIINSLKQLNAWFI